jgi:hypothetical protein
MVEKHFNISILHVRGRDGSLIFNKLVIIVCFKLWLINTIINILLLVFYSLPPDFVVRLPDVNLP